MEGLRINIKANGGVDKYPAKAHARRVAEKLNVSKGFILLAATNARNWPNSDMPAPFRQERYFYYLTGCNEADTFVTYDIGKDLLTLWLPPINKARVLWYGRGSTVDEALEKYDIDAAHYIKSEAGRSDDEAVLAACSDTRHTHSGLKCGRKSKHLRPTKVRCSEVYILDFTNLIQACEQCRMLKQACDEGSPCSFCDENSLSCRYRVLCRTKGLWACFGAHDTKPIDTKSLRHAIDACRVIKDEHEIALIRRANDITAEAHISVMKGMHTFKTEADVEAAYMQVCIAKTAKVQAYDPIAGAGPNAAELHYSENTAAFGHGQTIVLDAGCEVECYASDVTRTLPINPKKPGHWPSEEAKNIYKLVEKIQECCIKQMLPGKQFIEIFWFAHQLVIEGLLELGILVGDQVGTIFAAGTSRAFLPHGLGHHVGLEVHDVSPDPAPPLAITREQKMESLRAAVINWRPEWACHLDDSSLEELISMSEETSFGSSLHSVSAPVLEPNMIVTVEPGIYFNKFLLDNFFLNDPKHRQFIDMKVLKRYMQVGGVRIEDDILITKNGYENITTAPKGEEMLEVIRKGAASGRHE